MTIADEVRAATKAAGAECTVGAALAQMSPAKRKEWEEVFASDLDGAAIARVLSKPQHANRKFQGQTVNRHRRKDCSCGDS